MGVLVTLIVCVCMCDCVVFDFLFLSVMLVRLHFVQNKHVKCYILSHRPTRLIETALSRRLMSVVWIRPYSERVQTAADSVYTARRDATRQFCRVELSGVNCVLMRVHSGRTGLNWTAIQFSAIRPLWTTLYGYLQELSTHWSPSVITNCSYVCGILEDLLVFSPCLAHLKFFILVQLMPLPSQNPIVSCLI